MKLSARLSADVEIARRIGLGVGDDQVVELLDGRRVIGYLAPAGYEALRSKYSLALATLRQMRCEAALEQNGFARPGCQGPAFDAALNTED